MQSVSLYKEQDGDNSDPRAWIKTTLAFNLSLPKLLPVIVTICKKNFLFYTLFKGRCRDNNITWKMRTFSPLSSGLDSSYSVRLPLILVIIRYSNPYLYHVVLWWLLGWLSLEAGMKLVLTFLLLGLLCKSQILMNITWNQVGIQLQNVTFILSVLLGGGGGILSYLSSSGVLVVVVVGRMCH